MRFSRALLGVGLLFLIPTAASAQATLAGTVKDSSGAVLPGVSVEASSPVLIEKTRSGLTDATGQYRITDLLPGTYALTFTLSGFATIKREAIELTGAVVDLVEQLGGQVIGLVFVVELEFLPGRKRLEGYDVRSLIKYQS